MGNSGWGHAQYTWANDYSGQSACQWPKPNFTWEQVSEQWSQLADLQPFFSKAKQEDQSKDDPDLLEWMIDDQLVPEGIR
ncbi:MAG: hypothetical protein ABEK42_07225 [Thiohalorhabdaceae bacterium]